MLGKKTIHSSSLVGLCFCLMSAPTFAENETVTSLYFGVGAGMLSADLPSALLYYPPTSTRDTDTGINFIAGDELARNVSMELGYVMLGKYEMKDASRTLTEDVSAYTLSVNLKHHVSNRAETFLRIGAYKPKVEYNYSENSSQSTITKTSFGYMFGIGAQVNVVESLYGRIEWQFYNKVGGGFLTNGRQGSNDISGLSLSAIWMY